MNIEQMTGAQIDTLIALVERGPLDDGYVPSKAGRDDLVEAGLAARIVVNGEDGFNAATYAGREAYLKMFGADTIREAIAMRQAQRTIRRAQYPE